VHRIQTRPVEGDRITQEVVDILSALTMSRLTRPPKNVELDVCATCGSLERADRACQVCLARRRANLSAA
jgi:ribosomal protein L32